MWKIWKTLPYRRSRLAPLHATVPLYSLSMQGIVQSNTHQKACHSSSLAKEEFYSQTLFVVRLSSHNLVMSWRGRQITTYTIFYLLIHCYSFLGNCAETENITERLMKKSDMNRYLIMNFLTKRGQAISLWRSRTSCLTVIRSKILITSNPVIWIYKKSKIYEHVRFVNPNHLRPSVRKSKNELIP